MDDDVTPTATHVPDSADVISSSTRNTRSSVTMNIVDAVATLAIWLGVAFSLGWYYTITYYGHTGIPVPTPESCSALILYYFSVLNVATETQAVQWMAVFPIAAVLWTSALIATAPRFGAPRPPLWRTLRVFALCSVPIVLPGPWLMMIAGATDDGFSWHRMMAVALRRGNVSPWAGLNALYVGLGVLTLFLQILVYRRVFTLGGIRAWRHAGSSAIALVVVSAVSGALIAFPLRAMFE